MPAATYIAVDVGNSRTKTGLFELSQSTPICSHVSATDLNAEWPSPEFFDVLEDSDCESIQCVVVGSNQAGVANIVSRWPKQLAQPLVINSYQQITLAVHVDHPERVGLDRLLNAVAVHSLVNATPETAYGRAADSESDKPRSSTIVVDSGTATTIDLISPDGAFEGGAIMPGFDLSARALNLYTEALPLFTLHELVDESNTAPRVLGKNTAAAIASGVYWGQVGAVREVVAQLSQSVVDPRLIITGGGAELLIPHFDSATLVPHLGLLGLIAVAQAMQR